MKKLIARMLGVSIEEILERGEGGVYKRIDENREVAQFLTRWAPELLRDFPEIMSRLRSQDIFLSALSERPLYDKENCLFRPDKEFPREFIFERRERTRNLFEKE